MTYIFLLVIYCYLFKGLADPFWAYVLMVIFLPLQAFFNALIYFFRQGKDNLVSRTASKITSFRNSTQRLRSSIRSSLRSSVTSSKDNKITNESSNVLGSITSPKKTPIQNESNKVALDSQDQTARSTTEFSLNASTSSLIMNMDEDISMEVSTEIPNKNTTEDDPNEIAMALENKATSDNPSPPVDSMDV